MPPRKVANGKAVKVKQTGKVIVFQAVKRLTKKEFELLSDMVRHEMEKTGVKIVLMPYSCELAPEDDQERPESE